MLVLLHKSPNRTPWTLYVFCMFKDVSFSMGEKIRTHGILDVLETLYKEGETLHGHLGHSGFKTLRTFGTLYVLVLWRHFLGHLDHSLLLLLRRDTYMGT